MSLVKEMVDTIDLVGKSVDNIQTQRGGCGGGVGWIARPLSGESLHALGLLYYQPSDFVEAEAHLLRANSIREGAFGPDYAELVDNLNNLAETYRAQEKDAEVAPLLLRALKITESALGPEHSDVAMRLSNLASLYEHLGRFGDAEGHSGSRGREFQERGSRQSKKMAGKIWREYVREMGKYMRSMLNRARSAARDLLFRHPLCPFSFGSLRPIVTLGRGVCNSRVIVHIFR